jgi:fructokinase
MRIGVDLGGTKIEAIALGPGGRELARRRIPTPRDYRKSIAALVELVAGLEHQLGERGTIGVGTPGAISPATGLIKNSNSTWLNGKPLDRDLAAALGRPVRLMNDANCFALSEASDGTAAGARVVFGVILGTGVGGGLVVHGHCLEGPNRIAGEWGHNPLPWPRPEELPGPACYCGQKGCIETFLSGPGFEKDHAARSGTPLASPDIVARATAGDDIAAESLARYADRLARGLASVINIVDPDVIVLGGGMSNIDALYDLVRERLPRHVFSDEVATRLVKNRHGDSSGVRGAAWLWPERGE